MRHGNKVNALGRKYGHRKAMMTNMASSLIRHKRIRTTTAKAKALRKYVEPIINRGKENSTHNRRMAFRYLQDKYAVTELFEVVAAKVGDRQGGYTRILKLGNRFGDNAEMSIIELVDFNENMLKEAKKKTRRSRRSRRGKGTGSKAEAAVESKAAEVKEEASAVAAEATEAVAEATEATTDAAEAVADTAAETTEQVADAAEEAKSEDAKPEDDAADADEKKG
jgi:large subunit ribosomal protein L17